MPQIRKPSRRFAIFLMLLNTVAWGAALPIVKPALSYITPYQFLLYRYIFAAIFSFPLLVYYLPKIKHLWKKIGTIVILELIGTTLALGMLYKGLSYTTSIQASLIATTTPIFIILGGIFFLREKEETHEWLGLLLAAIGTLLLTLEPMLKGTDALGPISWTGNVFVIGQNLATAAYFLLAKKQYLGIPKLFVTTISYYVGMISFLFIDAFTLHGQALGFNQPMWVQLSHPAVFIAVLYMATFGSIIGLTAYIRGQDGMEASEASVFTYLQPLVFIPLSVLWLSEKVSTPMIIAVVFIAVGVWVSEYRPKRKLAPESEKEFAET
ncbi:MAG: DMT family transporter [Patescibacteria group bacterium]